MARVTVEDCIQVVNNRYELVLLAAQRARDIAAGSPLTIDRDNDKNPVVALREIAEQTINLDQLRRHIARGVNRTTDLNTEDSNLLSLTEQGPEMMAVATAIEMEEVSFEEVESVEEADENDAELGDEDPEEALLSEAEAAFEEESLGEDDDLTLAANQ